MYQIKLGDRWLDCNLEYRLVVRHARGLAIRHRIDVEIYRHGEPLDIYRYTACGPKRHDTNEFLPFEMRVRKDL